MISEFLDRLYERMWRHQQDRFEAEDIPITQYYEEHIEVELEDPHAAERQARAQQIEELYGRYG